MTERSDRPYIVQFPHPGGEHRPRREGMDWNRGPQWRVAVGFGHGVTLETDANIDDVLVYWQDVRRHCPAEAGLRAKRGITWFKSAPQVGGRLPGDLVGMSGSAARDAPRLVLIVSGVPGSGKSSYAEHLEGSGWARLSVDNPEEANPAHLVAFARALAGDLGDLRALATTHSGVVIEWGFDPVDVPKLAGLVAQGCIAWYFNGDRDAAYAGWRKRHPDWPERLWLEQMARLERAAPEIWALFGSRFVSTVGPGPTYCRFAQIDQALGIVVPTGELRRSEFGSLDEESREGRPPD